jgi:hypothetical protein
MPNFLIALHFFKHVFSFHNLLHRFIPRTGVLHNTLCLNLLLRAVVSSLRHCFCFGAVELRCTVAAVIGRHPLAERMAFVNNESPHPVVHKSSGGRTIGCRDELGFGATPGSSPQLWKGVNAYGKGLFALFRRGRAILWKVLPVLKLL